MSAPIVVYLGGYPTLYAVTAAVTLLGSAARGTDTLGPRDCTRTLRPFPDRYVPRRRRPLGAAQLDLRQAARRCVRAAHRGHRRGPQPSGVDRGHPHRARLDRHRARRLRGPVLPVRQRRASTAPPPTKLHAAGRAYYCDCTRDDVQARTGSQYAGYDGFCRDRGLDRGPGRALRFRTPDEGATVVVDLIRGEPTFENKLIEDFVIARGDGSPVFLLANVVDDITHGHHPRDPRRGAPAQHAQAAAAVGGARARSRRSGRTCRWWSTRSGRSCPSAATRWPWRRTATRATSPTRCATT